MATSRAARFSRAGGPLEIVDREVGSPEPGWVRLAIEACGICHSDTFTQTGAFPGAGFPRVPGHEVIGVIEALGPDVSGWNLGERVGVGWHGGRCNHCEPCRRGEFFACERAGVTGLTHDGGYAEHALARATALARVPAALDAIEAAPLMCAGLTTFNALRNCDARPGDLVAVLGMGGLGHLAVQYASRMGFRTVVIARGGDKEPMSRRLGGALYVDSTAQDPAAELQKLGGARVVIATVTDGDAMTAVLGGLGVNGRFMVLGASGPLSVAPGLLISGRRSVVGWYSGTAPDAEATLAFSALTGVRSMNEVYPLARAAEAFERMTSGKARFRVVLTTKE